MDETPVDEPLSPPIVTEHEKQLLAEGKYDTLVVEQSENDCQLLIEVSRAEEMLELEEEAFIDARREAARVARLASGQRHQIINPARLLLHSTNPPRSWLGEEETQWSIAEVPTEEELDALTNSRLRAMVNRGYAPGPRSRHDSASSNGNGSHLGRERGRTSTPPSSVDLEWEHEAGIYLPPYGNGTKTDEDLTGTQGSDKCTTPPLSNTELEWDDAFESPDEAVDTDVDDDAVDLDLETEQLIQEIEQLTSQALRDTNCHR